MFCKIIVRARPSTLNLVDPRSTVLQVSYPQFAQVARWFIVHLGHVTWLV